MGGPGGNNPLNFGKSKAKFQMEPNTGITFSDVAGVDEAKADFMEVGSNILHLSAAQYNILQVISLMYASMVCLLLIDWRGGLVIGPSSCTIAQWHIAKQN